MSRTGDSPPQEGPRDGDAFAVFAAIAPFARRILEIDPDFLVDQAAELDDDAFAGFAALTTLLVDARQEQAEDNEPAAQIFAAGTGASSDDLNPWSTHAARGLYRAYPRLFAEAASIDVESISIVLE